MKVPVSWLREYVAFDGPIEAVAERLAVSTAEVDRISRRGVPDEDGNLGRFLVGRVVEAGSIRTPTASSSAASTSASRSRGRSSAAPGTSAPAPPSRWQLPGAVLPDGRTLERAKLRGARLRRDDPLGARARARSGALRDPRPTRGLGPGTPLGDVIPIRDDVLEIEVTGNRPDLLSIYGLAREVAALFKLELAPPPGADPPGGADERRYSSRSTTSRVARATSGGSSARSRSAHRRRG